MCSTGECIDCRVMAEMEADEPAYVESVGTCACGGDLRPFAEVHVRDYVTQYVRCGGCLAETTRKLPAE